MSRFTLLGVDLVKQPLQLKSGEVSFKVPVRAGVAIDKIKVGNAFDTSWVVLEALALRKSDGISKGETSVVEALDGSL